MFSWCRERVKKKCKNCPCVFPECCELSVERDNLIFKIRSSDRCSAVINITVKPTCLPDICWNNTFFLFQRRNVLERNGLLALYYSCIQTYINYANRAWGSNWRANLKKINSQQKHAIGIIFNKNKYTHLREIFEEQKNLNIYRLNNLSNIVFMHRAENKTAPSTFLTKFFKPSHAYTTNFSAYDFLVPTMKLKERKYRVSIRSLLLWNNIFTAAEKTKKVFQNSGLI